MAKALLHELGKSLSFGRLSLKAKVLWPMLLATSDNQGRGTAESDAIKWYVCPNVPEISLDDVPGLLTEMIEQGMLLTYASDRDCQAYQVIHWWEYQDLQWARPSKYAPPEGWTDRIRYSNRGDYHESEGWKTTGGFSAISTQKTSTPSAEEPARKPAREPAREPAPTQLENHVDFQPNLTELNLTQPNSTEPNLVSIGANAPPLPPPSDDGDRPPKKEPTQRRPLSTALKRYLEVFGRKRFGTIVQREALEACEKEVGSRTLVEAITWAGRKNIRDVDAIITAARGWGKNNSRAPPGDSGSGASVRAMDRIRKEEAARVAKESG